MTPRLRVVVVAQLVEWPIPTPEILGQWNKIGLLLKGFGNTFSNKSSLNA